MSSPVTSKADLVTFSIKSQGKTIKDTDQVVSITVRKAANRISSCEIVLVDGSAAKQDFPVSDSDTFVPGAKIEVLAGYENSNTSIFQGIVVQQQLQIDSKNGPTLVVHCQDEAVKMTVGRKNAYFVETTDSAIFSELIGKYDLEADVSSTDVQLKEVVQYYATDWDFLLSRTEVNGMVCMVEDGKIAIKRPEELTEEVLSLTYGYDIYAFDATIDAVSQLQSVQANAWDMDSQSVINANATPGNINQGNLSTSELAKVVGLDNYDLQSAGALEESQLEVWAKAEGTKSTYAKVRGAVKFQGSALAKPGTLVQLKGFGKRFNGKGFVSGVEHRISDGNWVSTAQLGLSPDWFTETVRTEAPLAAGLLPGIQGLQIGKVQQIHDDPDGEFRVLVTLPLIQSSDDGVWARLANFSATNEAGAFFYPEVEDEVVVGFLNDDPRYPVILGSLYSSSRQAPEEPDEENTIKAIVTREKLKITFDEEKRIITIITPGENQLILSDEDQGITLSDQNNNSIKLSSSGIDINSASNINIKATESITIDGPSGLTATASSGSISLSAISISHTADVEYSVNASASASFSSQGELFINGAMVMIN
ncbi:MAG: type VI secretion system tip protein VgrG [Bacteroidota bacterium]